MPFIRKGCLVQLTEPGYHRRLASNPDRATAQYSIGDVFLVLDGPNKIQNSLGDDYWEVTVLFGEQIIEFSSYSWSGECFEDYLKPINQK